MYIYFHDTEFLIMFLIFSNISPSFADILIVRRFLSILANGIKKKERKEAVVEGRKQEERNEEGNRVGEYIVNSL